MERVITYVDKKYLTKRTVHPTVWINAMDRSLCTMRDDVHSELPPGAIVVSQFGMWRDVRGIALLFLPRPRYCYSIVPILVTRLWWTERPKRIRGSTRIRKMACSYSFADELAKNFKQCLGENIFTNVNECMYLYSQGIRTFMTDWYKDEPRFFLNKNEMLPEFEKYGGVGGEDAPKIFVCVRTFASLRVGTDGINDFSMPFIEGAFRS